MALFNSSNPVLRQDRFSGTVDSTTQMTLEGTINKTMFLTMLLIVSASYVWIKFFTSGVETVMPWMWTGIIGGLIFALITSFSPNSAPFTAPIYAILEGFAIGGLSAMFESLYNGITLQASAITFGILIAMLLLYKSGLIKVTPGFRKFMFTAITGIFIVYVIEFVLTSFTSMRIPYLHQGGTIGIIISLVIIGIASLSLILDFDFIEKSIRTGTPKHMEWYGAFGIMVTVIWIYIEILRLLAVINRRD